MKHTRTRRTKRTRQTRRTRGAGWQDNVKKAMDTAKAVRDTAKTVADDVQRNKDLVQKQNAFDPFAAASTAVGMVNPAMKDYAKKQIAEGVSPFVAKLKEDKLMGKSTGMFDVAVTKPVFDKLKGGKKTRKLRKGFMVRRVCAVSIVPVGVKTRRRR
jgi:hypothetical protein